ncbi:hypothetical protein BACCIP111883_02078 [Sutcliffiella rhizosphaerae]|uniref:Uncharacterized protein n=2 Tax=Sutcliffiella rhizosphaerae TaxID=2880967 RepID=A0ABM8YMT8_9BACI|nr:hypothetical protein BACCIP111883_02078 [Sutcliffiella rhizosphaerae]
MLMMTICLFVYFSFEESQSFEGFPIPKSAELTNKKVNFEEYDWKPASEENGLPLRYLAIIKLWVGI